MIDLWKNTFGHFHKVLVENELLWIYVALAIVMILSALVAFLLAKGKAAVEIQKLLNENEKLKAEYIKLGKESKKIDTEIQSLIHTNAKTQSESSLIKISEKEKMIALAKEVSDLNDDYNIKLEDFMNHLMQINEQYSNKKIPKSEVDKITSLFFIRIVNTFNNYFSVWKTLYSTNSSEKEDFINIRLKPHLSLSSTLLSKIIEIGGAFEGSMISSEVFYPIIKFAVDSGCEGIVTTQINDLSKIFKFNYLKQEAI